MVVSKEVNTQGSPCASGNAMARQVEGEENSGAVIMG